MRGAMTSQRRVKYEFIFMFKDSVFIFFAKRV